MVKASILLTRRRQAVSLAIFFCLACVIGICTQIWVTKASATPSKTLRRAHSGTVFCLAFSLDGKLLASGGEDKTIKIWDTRTHGLLRRFAAADFIGALAFSSDGNSLASGSALWAGVVSASPVKVWNIRSGRLLRTLRTRASGINSISFASRDKTLLLGSPNGTAQLWDARTGKLLWKIAGTGNGWGRFAFSRDGKTLVTGYAHDIKIWDVTKRKMVGSISADEWHIAALSFSRSGKRLAIGNNGVDESIMVIGVPARKVIRTILPFDTYVRAVAISPDGQTMASMGDEFLKLWNAGTGRLLHSRKAAVGAYGLGYQPLAFSPDSRSVANGGSDGSVRLWDVATGRLRCEFALPK